MSKNKKSGKGKKIRSNANSKALIRLTQDYGWWGVSALLVWTVILFSPCFSAEFVNWDDTTYIIDNSFISELSWSNIKAMFLSGISSDYPEGIAYNYHPLTILSLAINYQISGLNPGSYHFLNILLHLCNIILVYIFSKKLIPSYPYALHLMVAAIFAIHPLHVESVAWVSERKDVLFAFFYLLGLISYIHYLSSRSKKYLIYVALAFLASLLSKPAAVTFPIVLLLIDYWKDRKFTASALVEKIPFFILSIIFGLITLGIQGDVAVGDIEKYSIVQKISYASYGFVFYLYSFIAPFKPVTFYPYPDVNDVPLIVTIAPLLALVILGLIIYYFRKNKLVVFGFLFFLVNVLLTLQFVQVGSAIVSDRYSYLPYIGLSFALAYFCNLYMSKKERSSTPLVIVGIVYLLYFSFMTFTQAKVWKNSETLWTNVLDRFPNASAALNNRGNYYAEIGKPEKASADLSRAFAINPSSTEVIISQSNALRNQKKYKEAIEVVNKGIEKEPNNVDLLNTRANAYFEMQNYNAAIEDYEAALTIDPNYPKSYSNLGSAYFRLKKYDQAIENYNKAIELKPDYKDAMINKGAALISVQQYGEAIEILTNFIRYDSNNANVYNYRAIAYDRSKKYREALADYTRAIEINPNNKAYYNSRAEVHKAIGNQEAMEKDLQKGR
jgi:tetratricopeptide (TPR) repeat protein